MVICFFLFFAFEKGGACRGLSGDKLSAGEVLSETDLKQLKDYKIKLTLPGSLLDAQAAEEMTNEELLQRKEELLTKKVSSLHIHICRLIRVIQDTSSSERPGRAIFEEVPMVMSKAGVARWKRVVEGVEPFQSFKEFEQLHDLLTPELKERLCLTLKAARERAVLI
jgi:hypothetical protein